MALGPYRLDKDTGDRKEHLYDSASATAELTAACGRTGTTEATHLVSRAVLVSHDLEGRVCKRCLVARGLIDDYDETIAKPI